MKRLLTLLTVMVLGVGAFAQEEQPEQTAENPLLPKAGDFAVGIDGTPVFDYIGNMFNGTTNNALNLGDNTLYFRYYLRSNAAVRLKLRIATSRDVDRHYVQDDAAVFANPLSMARVEDKVTTNTNAHEVSVGYQMFRSYKRFRGFYGADLGFGINSRVIKYEYGNNMTELNPTPTNYNGNQAVRNLMQKTAGSKTISAGAFVGVEYYLMPQVCMGLEFGLQYGMNFGGQGYRTQERMVVSQRVEETVVTDAKDNSIGLYTGYPYTFGNIYFMFHF